jgi:hypothetical protein
MWPRGFVFLYHIRKAAWCAFVHVVLILGRDSRLKMDRSAPTVRNKSASSTCALDISSLNKYSVSCQTTVNSQSKSIRGLRFSPEGVTDSILTSPWRWRQHGPPKRWYPTATLHGVTTQKTLLILYLLRPEDGSSMVRRNVAVLPQHLHGVTTQKTSTWIFVALRTSNLTSEASTQTIPYP